MADPTTGVSSPASTGPNRARARRGAALTVLAALGVVVLLAFAPAAAVTASRMPEPLTRAPLQLPEGELAAATRIRAVPVGLPADTTIESVDDVRPFAVAALGPGGAEDVLLSLSSVDESFFSTAPSAYPYRYPSVDAVLDEAAPAADASGGTALGAALFLLAANPTVDESTARGAGRLAFAVLDRARAGGACDPQLDLLALVASDPTVGADAVDQELARARRACPGEPTPGWLTTQRTLHLLTRDTTSTEADGEDLAKLGAARASAAALVRAFPHDPGALATLGDVLLTTGRQLAVSRHFTARRALTDADTVFARIRQDRDEPWARLGAARAALGLGRPAKAAELATAVAEGSGPDGRAVQLVVSAQEQARRFDSAAAQAKALADRGAEAFPVTAALIPLAAPLSLGFDGMTPVTTSLSDQPTPGGGAVVDDFGFVPVFRVDDGLTDAAPHCPQWTWRRDALLAGDAAAAAKDWPEEFLPTDPTSEDVCPDGEPLRHQVDAQLAAALPDLQEDPGALEELEPVLDSRQNLLRWAGDLVGAREVAARWAVHVGGETALAHQRLGEIDFLLKDYPSAAAEFAAAAVRWRALDPGNDLAVDQALLGQGAALLQARRAGEAVAVLRPLVLQAAQGHGRELAGDDELGTADDFARVSYYASTLLGDHELASGQAAAAAQDYGTALLWADTLRGMVRLDAARNSAALAALGTGDAAGAVPLSRAALDADPLSPVYLMTSAEVAQGNGDVANALRQNRAALVSDPTDYPAANNLGVLLARRGENAQASRVLRAAVAENPDYALGWHNLGVVEGRRGPLHVVPSQGAVGRAIALDPALAAAPLEPTFDTTLYRTGLDVSKPIPPAWSFAGSQRSAPVLTAGLLAAVLAGVGLVSLRDSAPVSSATDWLDGVAARVLSVRAVRRFRHPVWAVVATAGTFLLAFWTQPLWPWTGLTYTVGLVALVAAGMAVRSALARRRVGGVVHGTWAPGVLVGLVSGAFGAPIAPLPVVRAPNKDARVALAAPLVLAVLSLALLLEAVLLHTPLAASFCLAAFVMSGSVLLPVSPLDGSRAGRAGVVGAAGLLGGILLLGLGLA